MTFASDTLHPVAQRLVFHVGLMKSGTTFLQGRLDANRSALAAQGVLFPGPSWGRQVRAVTDLIEGKNPVPGSWASLREELLAHPGVGVVSMEYLGPIGAPRMRHLVEELPGPRLEVVVTVRDLGRSVPAMWQEFLKNRQTWDWADYLRQIEHGGPAHRRFWRQQDAGRIVRRWARVLGPEQVTVVTVPEPGGPPELLWERFREAVGIAEASWREAPRANESLGAASARLMLRLNQETQDLSRAEYKGQVKALAKHVLAGRRRLEDPIGYRVPRWLTGEAERIRREIGESGVRVVGSLQDLAPTSVRGVDPDRVSAASQHDAAVAGLLALLRRQPAEED